jgi:rubrerythrin
MVTTVGTANDLPTLIEDFILLERDAIAAYEATVERLEDPARKAKIEEFRQDHLRHLDELQALALRHGADAPLEGDAKEILTTGKVKLAGMVGGDGMILKAMSTNETDTVTAYSNGCDNPVVPADARALFERGLADERRHKDWMDRAGDMA